MPVLPDFKATLVYVLGAMGPLGRMFTAWEGKKGKCQGIFYKGYNAWTQGW